MKYPLRLLESPEDDLARRVLRSAEHDRPSPSAMAGTGRLLGLGAALAGSLSGGAAGAAAGASVAGTATSTTAAGAAATGAAQLGGVIVAKYMGIGVIASVLATGGAVAVRSAYHTAQERRTASEALPSASAAAREVAGATRAFAASPTEQREAPSGPLEARHPERTGSSSRAAPNELQGHGTGQASPEPSVAAFALTEDPPALGVSSLGPAGPSLSEEVALLDRARQALRDRNPAQALRQLDTHAERVPHGSLMTEATVLRVEALVQAGRRNEAVLLARRIIAQAPESRHASRVRILVPEARQE